MYIELPPELEARLQQEADRRGVMPSEYARRLLENSLPPRFLSARELLQLPRAEQDRYLAAAAEDAAPLYAAYPWMVYLEPDTDRGLPSLLPPMPSRCVHSR